MRPGRTSGYTPQSRDTSEWADRMLFDHWRRMEPAEKGDLIATLCRSLHEVTIAGLRARHPEASPRELELLAARRRLGDELVERVLAAERKR